MNSIVALTLFFLLNIILTLCGGFSIWVFTRVMVYTTSWRIKACTFFISGVQILFVYGLWVYPAFLYLYDDLGGPDVLFSTIAYCLDIFCLLTLFYAAIAIRFYQKRAHMPHRGPKSFGLFIMCLIGTLAVCSLVISLL